MAPVGREMEDVFDRYARAVGQPRAGSQEVIATGDWAPRVSAMDRGHSPRPAGQAAVVAVPEEGADQQLLGGSSVGQPLVHVASRALWQWHFRL